MDTIPASLNEFFEEQKKFLSRQLELVQSMQSTIEKESKNHSVELEKMTQNFDQKVEEIKNKNQEQIAELNKKIRIHEEKLDSRADKIAELENEILILKKNEQFVKKQREEIRRDLDDLLTTQGCVNEDIVNLEKAQKQFAEELEKHKIDTTKHIKPFDKESAQIARRAKNRIVNDNQTHIITTLCGMLKNIADTLPNYKKAMADKESKEYKVWYSKYKISMSQAMNIIGVKEEDTIRKIVEKNKNYDNPYWRLWINFPMPPGATQKRNLFTK